VQVHVLDRQTFNPVLAGLTTIETIRELYPKEFEFKKPHFDNLIGNDWVRQDIEQDVPVSDMRARWQKPLAQFEQVRRKYLLYH
jgi:beta-N-acetylhexosaminidase